MPKQTYQPTEADKLTGQNVRKLRRAAGETLQETIDRSGIDLRQSSLSRTELGQRQLTVPEATKLAAHWNTTADKIIVKDEPFRELWNDMRGRYETGPAYTEAELAEIERRCAPPTEQEWLGNAPALFAVPEPATELEAVNRATRVIYLDQPLTPAEYREQVWVPYLEQRYATDLQQTG